ncbi:MAG TPA: hypothetical protein VIA18_04995 [Polyangia bacterium]|nr:hypothetical protein [Polyangia bacterium]
MTVQVLEHLERRRAQIVEAGAPVALVRAEVERGLVPVRTAYEDAQLPRAYFDALATELTQTLPEAWRSRALPYTTAEKRDFAIWRGGDPVARITYVFIGLVIGGLCVEAPFIPIWEKWFPFLLAALAWWLPTAQLAWHRRRYSRALGGIVLELARVQPQLDGTIRTEDLLLADSTSSTSSRDKGDSRGE